MKDNHPDTFIKNMKCVIIFMFKGDGKMAGLSIEEMRDRLSINPMRYANMDNFMENYPPIAEFRAGESFAYVGISDRPWVYLFAEKEEEFSTLIHKTKSFSNFAVLTDEQLRWLDKIQTFQTLISCGKYCLSKDKIVTGFDCSIEILNETDGDYIYAIYAYRGIVTKEYLLDLIYKKNMYGIKHNGVPFAMIGIQDDGAIGLLQVLPEYRKKGYATALVSECVKMMRMKGKIPFAHIEKDHTASLALVAKMGFEFVENVHWVILN